MVIEVRPLTRDDTRLATQLANLARKVIVRGSGIGWTEESLRAPGGFEDVRRWFVNGMQRSHTLQLIAEIGEAGARTIIGYVRLVWYDSKRMDGVKHRVAIECPITDLEKDISVQQEAATLMLEMLIAYARDTLHRDYLEVEVPAIEGRAFSAELFAEFGFESTRSLLDAQRNNKELITHDSMRLNLRKGIDME